MESAEDGPNKDNKAEKLPVSKTLSSNKKSVKQAQKLTELKKQIQDLMKPEYTDDFLNAWLKARKYDVNKAEQMFRSSIKFKEMMGVESLLTDYNPPEVVKKYMTGGYCGYDHDGSPIRVEMYGYLDLKGLMYSAKRSDLERAKLYQSEVYEKLCKEQSSKLGKRVIGMTVLFNMDKVGMSALWRPGLNMYMHLVRMMEDNYPEMMKKIIVINAPGIFPILYKVARPLLSADIKQKIHVLSGNFLPTLLKYMDEDQIPMFLGGTKTDPDGNPLCVTFINHGGVVPEEYHLNDQKVTDNLTAITVPRADTVNISFNVTNPNSIVRWEFKTEDYDIAFGIWRYDKNGVKEHVFPSKRFNSHIMTEDGSCEVIHTGEYYACFDNSFSWTKSKSVLYSLEVIDKTIDDEIKPDIHNMMESKESEEEQFDNTPM